MKPVRLSAALSILLTALLVSCNKEDTPPSQSPTSVQIQIAQPDSFSDQLLFSGSLEARKSYKLAFMVPGRVSSVDAEEGQSVQKGQTLATLENDEYRQAYEAAQARLEQVDDKYERLKNMYESNSLTKGDFLEISSKKKEVEANATKYRKKLESTRLQAPADGIIKRVSTTEGEVIKEGIPVITTVQADRLFAVFSIPESQISSIAVGDSVRVLFNGIGIQALSQPSTITKIKPVADPLSRSFKAYGLINNSDLKLKPGMLAQVHLHGESGDQGIAVSPDLLVHRNNTLNLWTLTNGKALLKRVLTGDLTANKIRITQGLQPGDTIITSGMELREGESVKVVE